MPPQFCKRILAPGSAALPGESDRPSFLWPRGIRLPGVLDERTSPPLGRLVLGLPPSLRGSNGLPRLWPHPFSGSSRSGSPGAPRTGSPETGKRPGMNQAAERGAGNGKRDGLEPEGFRPSRIKGEALPRARRYGLNFKADKVLRINARRLLRLQGGFALRRAFAGGLRSL